MTEAELRALLAQLGLPVEAVAQLVANAKTTNPTNLTDNAVISALISDKDGKIKNQDTELRKLREKLREYETADKTKLDQEQANVINELRSHFTSELDKLKLENAREKALRQHQVPAEFERYVTGNDLDSVNAAAKAAKEHYDSITQAVEQQLLQKYNIDPNKPATQQTETTQTQTQTQEQTTQQPDLATEIAALPEHLRKLVEQAAQTQQQREQAQQPAQTISTSTHNPLAASDHLGFDRISAAQRQAPVQQNAQTLPSQHQMQQQSNIDVAAVKMMDGSSYQQIQAEALAAAQHELLNAN